jgi:hypothetical protein
MAYLKQLLNRYHSKVALLITKMFYITKISFVQKPKTFPLVKQVQSIVILVCH